MILPLCYNNRFGFFFSCLFFFFPFSPQAALLARLLLMASSLAAEPQRGSAGPDGAPFGGGATPARGITAGSDMQTSYTEGERRSGGPERRSEARPGGGAVHNWPWMKRGGCLRWPFLAPSVPGEGGSEINGRVSFFRRRADDCFYYAVAIAAAPRPRGSSAQLV